MRLERGTVVLLELDPSVGREQRGVRPCIVVSDPAVIADRRFPLVAIVAATGAPGQGALYPVLPPGRSGLTKTSYAFFDHLRPVDKRRIRRIFGVVSTSELDALDEALVLFLGLGAKLTSPEAD